MTIRSKFGAVLMAVVIGAGVVACAGQRGGEAAEEGTPTSAVQSGGVERVAQIERVVMGSGLVIEDLQVGTGEMCLPSSWVRVRYTCRLEDGKLVDGSGDETLVLHLPRMIRGWQDGVPGMRVGGRRRLTVPPALGYGSREMRNTAGEVVIPANSTLVYEVDLLGIEPGPTGGG